MYLLIRAILHHFEFGAPEGGRAPGSPEAIYHGQKEMRFTDLNLKHMLYDVLSTLMIVMDNTLYTTGLLCFALFLFFASIKSNLFLEWTWPLSSE